jgi:hypothetical protein
MVLAAGGGAFPFALPSGFTGFETPATFVLFNRALRARVAVYTGDYAGALTALAGSFLNTGGPLDQGVPGRWVADAAAHGCGPISGQAGGLLGRAQDQVVDDDRCACAGGRDRVRAPEALAGAGDDRHLALQIDGAHR